MKIQFSEEKLKEVNELISHYPEGKQKSALIPILHIAQDEFGGWLDAPVMDYVAEILNILPIEVYEVATFYSMLNTKPVGKYIFEVCRTGPCALNGSDKIIDYIKEKLGINKFNKWKQKIKRWRVLNEHRGNMLRTTAIK